MAKPTILITGAHPTGDMTALADDHTIIKIWETVDQAVKP